jgi:hypothetical protein
MVNMFLSMIAIYLPAIVGGLAIGYALRALATRELRREVEDDIVHLQHALGCGEPAFDEEQA